MSCVCRSTGGSTTWVWLLRLSYLIRLVARSLRVTPGHAHVHDAATMKVVTCLLVGSVCLDIACLAVFAWMLLAGWFSPAGWLAVFAWILLAGRFSPVGSRWHRKVDLLFDQHLVPSRQHTPDQHLIPPPQHTPDPALHQLQLDLATRQASNADC